MKKVIKRFFSFIFCFIAFVLISSQRIDAAQYYYENGNVSHTYNDIKVYSFNYDYITKFTSANNYYNGSKVIDNGVDIGESNFYSSNELVVSYNHYDNFWPFVEDNDEVRIYKYNSTREDFSSLFKLFSNEEGTYKLEEEGIYKIVYSFEDSVKYTDYIYIYKEFHKMNVTFDGRYNNISPTLKLTFHIDMEDAYNLVNNEYYYAFGKNYNNLSYTKINNIFNSSELNSTLYKFSKDITVNIDEGVNGDNYLYVKCVRGQDGYTTIKTSESVNITNRIQMGVYLVDDEENVLNDTEYYKIGDVLKFKLEFNIEVLIDSYFMYSFDNSNFISLTESASSVKTLYLEKEIDSAYNKLTFKSSKGSKIYVDLNDNSLPLDVIRNDSFVIDVIAPTINLDYVEGQDKILNKQAAKIRVNDSNLDKTYFYMKKCNNINKGACLDTFDDNYEHLNVSEFDLIDVESDNDVKGNGEALAIYVKTIDKAGNETIFIFYEENKYVIDNIIYEEESNPVSYYDVYEGSNVVGKTLFISNDDGKKIKNVKYALNDEEDLKSCELVEDKYVCVSFKNISFNFNAFVKIEDIYGNVEDFNSKYSYFMVKDNMTIGSYNFVFNSENPELYEFSTYMYNSIYNKDSLISFNEDMLLKIEEQLLLLNTISNKKVELIVIVNEEEYVIKSIKSELVFPSLVEVYSFFKNEEEYLKCSINGNACDLEVYLKYTYNTIDNYKQNRMIKIIMKDNTSKYVASNFETSRQINVYDVYNDYELGYVNNLNSSINKNDVSESVEILFNGGLVSKVDTSKLGTYYITRSFTNLQGGSYPLSYCVEIVDKEAPIIKLKNSKDYVIKTGGKLGDVKKWVDVSDNYDKNVQIKYSFDKEFDADVEGKYVISIWGEDSSGNISNVVTRGVMVESARKETTYIALITIVLGALCIIVVGIILEKKKQKRIS